MIRIAKLHKFEYYTSKKKDKDASFFIIHDNYFSFLSNIKF